jgi:hypothetical protein
MDGEGIVFLFATASRSALGPTQPPIQFVLGTLLLRIKRPGREADRSPTPSIKVNVWSYTSTPPYVFLACGVFKHSEFTSTLLFQGCFFTLCMFLNEIFVPLYFHDRGPPNPRSYVTFPNKQVFYGEELLSLSQPLSWRTNSYRLFAAAYSIYLHLPSASVGSPLHPQPEDAPYCVDIYMLLSSVIFM